MQYLFIFTLRIVKLKHQTVFLLLYVRLGLDAWTLRRDTLDTRRWVPCITRFSGDGSGVGVTKPNSSVPLISRFSPLPKHWLPLEYHIHIWQVLPQLSCGDTCQYECDANNLTGTFAGSKIVLTEKLTNGALVTPTPGARPPVNTMLITLCL